MVGLLSPAQTLRRPFGRYAVMVLAFSLAACSWERAFDSQEWKSAGKTPVENNIRLRMYNDLVKDGRLIGMNTKSVASLLGEPTSRERNGTLTYQLGREGGFDVTIRWMEVEFEDDVVKRVSNRS